MLTRRELLLAAAAPVVLSAAPLTPRERIDRVLRGETPDRTPYTFWYHFLDEKKPGPEHARTTLAFHHKFQTDLVKVMSDYPYPKPIGEWFSLKVEPDPFPRQIRALQDIRAGLAGRAHFVETLFNPSNVAEKLSSKDEVAKMKAEKPQRLLDALEIIAKSQSNHARRAIEAGASGIFLSIANSADADYAKFAEPFDRMILESVSGAPLNVLHIHGDHVDLPRFYTGWPIAAINYSTHGTKIPFTFVRQRYSGVLIGGLDETNFRKLSDADVKRQASDAAIAAGPKFILAGGCSVPNDTTDAELMRVVPGH
jgi:uroporphyrinogen decarboxylase